jgi:Mg2+ and Co2+ transporter CorA
MSDENIGFTVKELFVEIRDEVRSVAKQVNEILQHGSQHARAALEQVQVLDKRIDRLEVESASKDAVEKNSNQVKVLAVITILGVMVEAIIHILFRH